MTPSHHDPWARPGCPLPFLPLHTCFLSLSLCPEASRLCLEGYILPRLRPGLQGPRELAGGGILFSKAEAPLPLPCLLSTQDPGDLCFSFSKSLLSPGLSR